MKRYPKLEMKEGNVIAVIDTNVLVSGLLARNEDSSVVKVFCALLNGSITPLINEEIILEYEDVLHRPKLKLPVALVDAIIYQIKNDGIYAEKYISNEIFNDPKDLVFYEIALSRPGSYLVTGNLKHFPAKSFVVSPAEMLRILDE